MKMKKKTVLLTGATGNMGREGLKQLFENTDRYHIAILSLSTPKDRKLLKEYKNDPSVRIIWGDLTNIDDVRKAANGVDIVLHVGALVSPAADHNPELAWKVNYEGTKNLVDVILERDDRDHLKLVFVGTVAETGNRAAPYHWGRIGDPILPSPYDYYALSKIAAERYVIESGLKHWVSVRQSGILHDQLLEVNDGIGYHQPINNHLEWVTARDSGRLLLNICSDEVPETFWRNVYNIGGGESCRLTSFQFYQQVSNLLGIEFLEIEEPNWYALRNFHGQYYIDSDKLEDLLHFRSEDINYFFNRIKKKLPVKMKILKFLPKKMLKNIMRKKALKGDTPLNWIKNNNEAKITAFFGSKEKWEQIPSWDKFEIINNPSHHKLNHGYNEATNDADLSFEDLQSAAEFRGGKCLSTSMTKGDLYTKEMWECAYGHEFRASPFLVLKAGHWCKECMKTPWNFDEQAKNNLFLAQVWYADHDKDENNKYQ